MLKHISMFLLATLFLIGKDSFANKTTQSIRGQVLDKSSQMSIIGAAVILKQSDHIIASAVTDLDGYYRIDEVEFGKYSIEVSFIGYQTYVNNEVVVQSGNQTILNIELQEASFELQEIEVAATEHRGDANNEYAVVSSRTFSIQETERYAGSRGEPSRMAANYAGVLGNNDNSNDIVVRGNTPIGLLWRMDGVNIPNPNHFAAGGSTGGPVTILNNQTLANSDFLTGAFPSEYGNTVAGVFDLKSRNGNNEEYEFSGELGFLGIKARAEGPFKKGGKSSFLIAYRYSTFAAFEAINFPIGTDAPPKYQDLNVKLNFPLKNNANLSFFSVAGSSGIDNNASESKDPYENAFTDPTEDESFRSRMGVVGATYKKSINSNIFVQLTAYVSTEQSSNLIQGLRWDSINGSPEVTEKILKTDYDFKQHKSGFSFDFKQKLNPRHHLKYGAFVDLYRFDFIDSTLHLADSVYRTRIDYRGNGTLIQPFINWSWAVNEDLKVITGLHGQYWDVSNSMSFEPRIGLNYRLDNKKWLEAGFGNHSQILPTYTYFSNQFTDDGTPSVNNENVDFMRSWHAVLGYNQMITPYLRLKLETYYQWLYNVPVTVDPSSYSILNEGGEIERIFPESLENTGSGENFGFEFTLEKFFNNKFFVFASGSVFSSKYIASDGKEYNTLFNSGYAFNALGAREFIWGETGQHKLTAGAKITWAGGRRYSPLDLEESQKLGAAVYDYTQRNQQQFNPYFRFDVNVKYRINSKSVGHELGLDLVNVLNIENAFKENYNPLTQERYVQNQLGFLPLFYYRVDF